MKKDITQKIHVNPFDPLPKYFVQIQKYVEKEKVETP